MSASTGKIQSNAVSSRKPKQSATMLQDAVVVFIDAMLQNNLTSSNTNTRESAYIPGYTDNLDVKTYSPHKDTNVTTTYGICVAFQIINAFGQQGESLKLLYKHDSKHYMIQYYPSGYVPHVQTVATMKAYESVQPQPLPAYGGANPFTTLVEMLKKFSKEKTRRVSSTEPMLVVPLPILENSTISTHVDTHTPFIFEKFQEIPEVLIQEVLIIVAQSRTDTANMSSINKYFNKLVNKTHETSLSQHDKQMQKREQLYVFIIMICILERKRFLECKPSQPPPGHLHSVACECTTQDGKHVFSITTAERHHHIDTTNVTFNNGLVISLTSLNYGRNLTDAIILDSDTSKLSGLYRTVKQNCKPDLAILGQFALHYKRLQLQCLFDTSKHGEIKTMLNTEIDLAQNIVASKLTDYIENLNKLSGICNSTIMSRGSKTPPQYAAIIIGVLKSSLQMAMLILEKLNKVHYDSTFSAERLGNVMQIKDNVLELQKTSHILDTQRHSNILYDECVKAFEWIGGIKKGSDGATYACSEVLGNLHYITYAFMYQSSIPSIDLLHGYDDLFYIHIKKLETLLNANDSTQFSVLSDKIESDYKWPHIHYDRKSLMDLLLNGYDIDGDDVTHSSQLNIAIWNRIQKGTPYFTGIASMCLCAKSSYKKDQQIQYMNGFSDDEITSFKDLKFNFVNSPNSLNPDADPLYNELASLYISDYFKCHPAKLSTFLIPYINKTSPDIGRYEIDKYQSSIIPDLHSKQQAIWDAQRDLKQYEEYIGSQLKHLRDWLSPRVEVYAYLFDRIINMYKPLSDFVASLYMIAEFITLQHTDDGDSDTQAIYIDILGKVDTHNSEDINKDAFDINIAPLLTWTLVNRIHNLRRKLLTLKQEEIDEVHIYYVIHDIENYVLFKQSKMNIDEHLVNSVSSDTTIMRLFPQPQSSTLDLKDLVKIMMKKTMHATTLIDAINTVSNEAFVRQLRKFFTGALYCHVVTTKNITTITEIMKIIAKRNDDSALETKITALENAENEMRSLIATIKYKQLGGATKKIVRSFLLVTNTNTMRTIHKPIFKVGKHSNVRHNRELILVSEYKLILGKQHDRQVKFEIVRTSNKKEKRK
jgi:hypothetical protein